MGSGKSLCEKYGYLENVLRNEDALRGLVLQCVYKLSLVFIHLLMQVHESLEHCDCPGQAQGGVGECDAYTFWKVHL